MRELHDCTFLLSLLDLHTTDHPLFDELVGWKWSETRRSDVGSVGRDSRTEHLSYRPSSPLVPLASPALQPSYTTPLHLGQLSLFPQRRTTPLNLIY
jgi:hypothetical protein